MEYKEILKKNLNIILLICTIIISCIIYWNYLTGHYSTETYGVALSYQNYGRNVHLVDGRFFSFALFEISGYLNIPILAFMGISAFLAIIIASVSVLQLKQQIYQLLKLNTFQEIIVYLICYSTILNFMLVEIMYFPETCIMVLSILLYIIAAKYFFNKRYLISSIVLISAVFCYQGTIGFFCVCCFTFSIIKNRKNAKEVLIDMLKMVMMVGVVACLNLLFIKGISQTLNTKQNKEFVLNLEGIKENIKFIKMCIPKILRYNCGLFPQDLLITFIGILILFTYIYALFYRKYKTELVLIILICFIILSSFAIFIVQKGSMNTGRVHFCIGSLFGIAMLYVYSATNIKDKKIWNSIFCIILLSYIVINILNAFQLVTEHKKTNELEKEECIAIGQMIDNYEKSTNKKVINIAPILILNSRENGFFKQTTRRTVVTYNNIRHYYGYSGVIQYYLRKKLKNTGLSKERQKIYKEYIEKNNLNYGDILCIDDTLYCPQYIT